MDNVRPGLRPVPLESRRLVLRPLRVDDAEEAAVAFDDVRLHTYMGGVPAGVDELRARYARQVAGRSPDGLEDWLNWMVRDREQGAIVAFAQATLRHGGDGRVAELAWVVASPQQGQGFAKEAADTVAAWLRQQGVGVLIAHIHPGHRASIRVAEHLGMTATDTMVDGEIRWTT